MGAETVGLLIVVGVIVVVLALYLITIGLALTRLNRTLAGIVAGLMLIRDRTTPVESVLGDILGEVEAIEEGLGSLAAAVGGQPATPTARRRSRGRAAAAEADGVAETDRGATDEEAPRVAGTGLSPRATSRTPRPHGVKPPVRPRRTSRRSRARMLQPAATAQPAKSARRRPLALPSGADAEREPVTTR